MIPEAEGILVGARCCFKGNDVPVTGLWERLALGMCIFGTVTSQPAAFLAQGAH